MAHRIESSTHDGAAPGHPEGAGCENPSISRRSSTLDRELGMGVKKRRVLLLSVDEDNVDHVSRIDGPREVASGQIAYRPKKDSEVDEKVAPCPGRSVVEEDEVWADYRLQGAARPPKRRARVLSTEVSNTGGQNPFFFPSPPRYLEDRLPDGVICIDSGAAQIYEEDRMEYLRNVEEASLQTSRLASMSKSTWRLLSEWLMEVMHYLKCCQETLYQMTNMLYAVASKKKIISKDLQLVGVTCAWIATKLEEYYSPEQAELLRLTKNTYTKEELTQMEEKVLGILGFHSWSLDPMTFLERFICAAFRLEDVMFLEVCTLLLDTLVTDIEAWSLPPSKKAAAAVYAGLNIFPSQKRGRGCCGCWSPTLEYYSLYKEDDLRPLAVHMLKLLLMDVSGMGETASFLTIKYASVSRHRGLMSTDIVTEAKVENAICQIDFS